MKKWVHSFIINSAHKFDWVLTNDIHESISKRNKSNHETTTNKTFIIGWNNIDVDSIGIILSALCFKGQVCG